ncbi:MAG: nucleotidyltransferase family protein [Candidatus Gastranaerophilales bacterium]|nr:nucleotidyltransferase family protein [Candidatus Gastranaerophilales bacterium]
MTTDKVYSIEEIKGKIKEQESFLKQKYHASKFLLFGSYAKGEQTPDSDIDLLVEFQETVDMFEMIDLQEYLCKLFDKKVDLGTPKGLKSFIKNIILKEAIAL